MTALTIPLLLTLATLRLLAAADPVTVPASPDTRHQREWTLLTRKAQAELQQHQLAAAAASAMQALKIAKRYPAADNRTGVSYYQLGNVYRDWGHCGEARASYSRAIAEWKKLSQPKPEYLFNTVVSLLGTLCECDDFDAAKKTLRVYEPELQGFKAGPLDEARVLAVRAVISRSQKEYRQAETYYRQAIRLMEENPGSSTLQIDIERSNLAMVIGKQGRPAESLAESERVIARLDRGETPSIAFVGALNNAACALADLGRKDESERMFERALHTARLAYGEDNRFTAKIMLNYARVLRENQETPAAEEMQKEGIATFRRALARDNSVVDIEQLRALR